MFILYFSTCSFVLANYGWLLSYVSEIHHFRQYWSSCETRRTFSYQPMVMPSYWKLVTLGLPGESSMPLIIALIFSQAQFFLACSTKWHDLIRLFIVVILSNSIHSDMFILTFIVKMSAFLSTVLSWMCCNWVICCEINFWSDFRSLVHENLAATMCGSPYYMAPEIWQGKDYDAKVSSFPSLNS